MILVTCLLLLQSSPILISGDSFSDLTPLVRAIGSRTIVEIGEATHGGAEFYRLKLRLVKYLHEKQGFNILAIEAGMIETGLGALRRNEMSAREFMMSTVSGGMRWREMEPLFAYIQSRPKLRVIGIDPQFSATEVLEFAHDAVAPYRPKLAAQIQQRLGEPYQYQALATTDPAAYAKAESSYLQWLEATHAHLDRIQTKPEDARALAILRQGFAGLGIYWKGASTQTQAQRFELRDRTMADHVLAQAARDKVMIWAHNGHIGRGIGYQVMGDHLRRLRPGGVYGLGLFAKSGEWREHWTGQVKPWATATDGIESQSASATGAWFSPTKLFDQTATAFEPENGGLVRFQPNRRFDGVMVVDRLSPTTAP